MFAAAMLCLLLSGPDPVGQVFTTADIALLNEALDLDQAQQLAMAQLIRDFDDDARQARTQATAATHSGLLWDRVRNDEEAWRTSTAVLHALRAKRKDLIRRQSTGSHGPLPDPHELPTINDRIREASANTVALAQQRNTSLQAARTASPNLQGLFAEQRNALLRTLDTDISVLLTGAQQAAWPDTRRTLMRGRRLRQLDIPGADIDVWAWVHRTVALDHPAATSLLAEWATEVDQMLDRIETQQSLVEHESEPASVAAACRERIRLEAIVADLALSTIEQLAAASEHLQGLVTRSRKLAFPSSYGWTTLHQIEDAARAGNDAELAAKAAAVLEHYRAARSEVLGDWLAAERNIALSYFSRKCEDGNSSDFDLDALVALSSEFQSARFALINDHLKELQRRIPPARIELALPGIKLPPLP